MATMKGLDIAIRSKSFGRTAVLGTVEFRLEAGERLALLGDSGVGKSTLLALIIGYDTDFEGAIHRPDGRAAMVFQTPRLLPWRTLAQNIALTPSAGSLPQARKLLAEVGLGRETDDFPEKISLGMQRRVALARAMAVDPSLILLDEPLVSLDQETAAGMRTLLVAVMDRTAATCVIATHDRREALAIADRVIEIGGRPATVLTDRVSPLERTARTDPEAVEALHADWFAAPRR